MSDRSRFILFVVLAALEVLTLAVLLVNLATVHERAVTRFIGPVHGVVYLLVVLLAIFAPGMRLGSRLLALIPVVGGVLAAWSARPRAAERPTTEG